MQYFVYGTLTDPAQTSKLLDSFSYQGRAVLHGLHRVDGGFPTLCPGGRVEGRILETPERETLDRYEGVDRGLYVPVTIPLEQAGSVQTYIGDPQRLGLERCFPGDGPFEERVRRAVADGVRVTRQE